jgi:hypothetical protein
MELTQTYQNELTYTPYTRIAMGVEDLVDSLQAAFLTFNQENDTTATAYRIVQALYAKCFFDLSKVSNEGRSREDYKNLVKDFTKECKMYEDGQLPYEQFESRFSDYLSEFIFMKALAGFRMRRKEKKDYTSQMKADVQDDLEAMEKEEDYEDAEA